MTRKDYVAIAEALGAARRFCETGNQRRGTERAVHCVADVMAADNPRFLKACGVQS
jgi:hypothetical protein